MLKQIIVLLIVLVAELESLLYPQDSETRELKSLDGIWDFRADYDNVGFAEKWFAQPLTKMGPCELMPVPSSYNDITQSKRLRDHVGWVWYSTKLFLPKRWKGNKIFLRFGAANRYSVVWMNGLHVMNHSNGYLPFEADVSSQVKLGAYNFITLALNNTLTPSTIPQGTLHYPQDRTRYPENYTVQDYNFDYFNYAGIHRPVHIHVVPATHINDITLITEFEKDEGRVHCKVGWEGDQENSIDIPTCVVKVLDEGGGSVASAVGRCGGALLTIPGVKLWWPYLTHPSPGYLYTLEVNLLLENSNQTIDTYRLKFGVRTVSIQGNKFFINKKPFYFHGFGRHEDYSIRGRGVDYASLLKDHNLIMWSGANSYRTSHYPYSEETMDLTDRFGIVVIAESQAIGLTGFSNSLRNSHIEIMKELVERDKNRASVVMWSIGNEPKSMEKEAPNYFEHVIRATREFDPSKRPITIVLNQNFSEGQCPSLDVISINRYFGWYSDTGRTEVIPLQIPTEVNLWYESYRKPVLITEYGAGAVAGMHQSPSFVWTEDYQADYLLQHFKAFDSLRENKDYFIGEMIWNFADFATPQETFRPWGCMKGVFTRERQPKWTAHLLRDRYWSLANRTATTSV